MQCNYVFANSESILNLPTSYVTRVRARTALLAMLLDDGSR
jgi:hypothetical protein